MRVRALALLLACSLPVLAGGGLHYRFQVWMRGHAAPLETRFHLLPVVPGAPRHGRYRRPRMAPWRLEAQRDQGTPYAQAMLLARAERLLYLSGPAPQTRREPILLSFGSRTLPVWSLHLPKGLDASGVMVEVAPGLLALCDLSARFPQGDVARLELHLVGLADPIARVPAEEGTALLSTLERWSRNPKGEASPAVESVH